jgi:hypothetical protein
MQMQPQKQRDSFETYQGKAGKSSRVSNRNRWFWTGAGFAVAFLALYGASQGAQALVGMIMEAVQ